MTASELILNSAPTFDIAASITTTGTQVGDSWTCFAEGSDPDDGSLTPTYEWQDASGNVIGSTDTLTLTAGNSNPTGSITCTATIIDSDGSSATSSASETVTNTVPVFDAAASITPATGVTTATLLTCAATASDADGDAPVLNYEWTNSDGTVYASTSTTLQLDPSTVIPGIDQL